MQRCSSALFCLTLSAAIVMTPSLTNIGDHGLYNSAWAKNGGNSGGGNGGSNNGGGNTGGGSGNDGGGGKSSAGKSRSYNVTGSGKAKTNLSSALNTAKASIAAANAAVAIAQKALADAIQAFKTALAEAETDTNTLLRLEKAITAAENSLRKASAKAAVLDQARINAKTAPQAARQ